MTQGYDAGDETSSLNPVADNPPSRVVLICGAFHRTEVSEMIGYARAEAELCGLEIVHLEWVPGAMEVPLALRRELSRDDVDGAVCLGIIEAGETQHGLAMGQAVISAIIELQLSSGKPIGLGIIGPGAEPQHIAPRLETHARAAIRAVRDML
jgi:6,7-dimethyl-8-ribityllumazine synthase